MRYQPHTEADIRHMLEVIGVASIDELFDAIPEALQYYNAVTGKKIEAGYEVLDSSF